ncbi:MAG: hypothetical protein Q8M31_19950 [Beijerinckiaceae bacterium]|nr:hypothetical protein [Beijerinckiaceae bacterium]
MRVFELKVVIAVAGIVATGVMFATPRIAQALPVAPAPALESQVNAVQYGGGGYGARGGAVRSARPVGRPGVRPTVRPTARPGVRPNMNIRPGRPVAVAPGYRPGVRPGYRPGVRPPVYRPGRPVYGNWYRPYRWRPGTAIAAGAAIGVIGAASAAAYYGQPPEEGLCWYYTNPSRTSGFWDVCPY